MINVFSRAALAAALCAFSLGSALAQSAPMPAAPASAAGTAAPITYRSAFDGYTGHADVPVRPWREVNDQVGRIGGWRVYAREAQAGGAAPTSGGHVGHTGTAAPRPASAASGASSAPAATGGHAGHRP
jgi:hypothetical protein